MHPFPRVIRLPSEKSADILAQVAQKHRLKVEDLTGPSRLRKIILARQEAMWELRQRTRLSSPQIAAKLGRKDHTTALHGVRRHEARIADTRRVA